VHTIFLQCRIDASYCFIRSALLLTKGGRTEEEEGDGEDEEEEEEEWLRYAV
jgi:hypothetical protein